jgi:hypothetical protein
MFNRFATHLNTKYPEEINPFNLNAFRTLHFIMITMTGPLIELHST